MILTIVRITHMLFFPDDTLSERNVSSQVHLPLSLPLPLHDVNIGIHHFFP